jgi:hypothetical protein
MLKKILKVAFFIFVIALMLFTFLGFAIQINDLFHIGMVLSYLCGMILFVLLAGVGVLIGKFMDWLFR